MSCENVQELISSLLDRRVPAGQRESVLAHLESCRKCGIYYESLSNLQADLRRMAEPKVPARLASRLRVLASHERQRRLARLSYAARIRAWATRTQLVFDNLMRPMALPVAGGLLSALIAFCVLVPNLSFAHNFTDQAFFTYPLGMAVEQVPLAGSAVVKRINNLLIVPADAALPADANDVVELTIDPRGQVVDFAVARGKLTPDVQSIIMFSQFIPATNLGIPVTGKVRVIQVGSRSLQG
jgi:hypothetical protein